MEKRVIAIGNFDGVHLGHRALLEAAAQMAQRLGAEVTALSFTPHPLVLMGREPKLLCSDEEKRELLAATGLVDDILLLPFTEAVRDMQPEDFFREILVKKLSAAGIVVGENFRFGREGRGDAALLSKLCREASLECQVVPLVCVDGEPVSSSRIRKLIDLGYTEEAARLLGHNLRLFS